MNRNALMNTTAMFAPPDPAGGASPSPSPAPAEGASPSPAPAPAPAPAPEAGATPATAPAPSPAPAEGASPSPAPAPAPAPTPAPAEGAAAEGGEKKDGEGKDGEKKTGAHTDEATLLKKAKGGEEKKPGEGEAGGGGDAAKAGDAAGGEAGAAPTYEFKMPEGIQVDDKRLGDFTTLLGEHKISPEVGQALLDRHFEAMQEFATQAYQEQHAAFARVRGAWREEVLADPQIGGSGHETAMKSIATVLESFVPAEEQKAMDEFLENTGAGDNPYFLRMMHRIARWRNEPSAPPAPQRPNPKANTPPGGKRTALYDHPSSARMGGSG